MAVVASRSSMIGALLRIVVPVNRHLVLDFLRGLSRDELECLAEFEGACALEGVAHTGEESEACNQYRVLPAFFDPAWERWKNPDDCAHKTFIVLAWLKHKTSVRAIRIHSSSMKTV